MHKKVLTITIISSTILSIERNAESVKVKRYDELKVNDVVMFHGANVRIIKVTETPAPASEYYPNEKTIAFDIEPADEEVEKILVKFYSHGSYAGVGCLELELVKRDSQ